MADIIIKVLVPATEFSLLTLAEAKLMMLNIPGGVPPTDEQLQQLINQYSAMVATLCNRTFAKETVRETWRDFEPPYNTASLRLFLSHWPVKAADLTSIEAPRGSVLDPSAYELEEKPGKVELFNGACSEPVVVTYSGGYTLPDEAPNDLKQAVGLLIRQYRQMAIIGSGLRTIAHKESRVQYFSPKDMMAVQPTTGGGSVANALDSLLSHYRRIEV